MEDDDAEGDGVDGGRILEVVAGCPLISFQVGRCKMEGGSRRRAERVGK